LYECDYREVEVVCFDILLQVLILKELAVNIVRLQNGRLGGAFSLEAECGGARKNPPSEEGGYRTCFLGRSRPMPRKKKKAAGEAAAFRKKTARLPNLDYTNDDRLKSSKI